MKFRLIVMAAVLFSACGIKSDTSQPFEWFFDFQAEILRLESENPMVIKTVTREGQTQTVADTVDWAVEFGPFLEADINQPAYRDRYSVEIKKEGNIQQVLYKALDERLTVKKVAIEFEGKTCRLLEIDRIFDNEIMVGRSHLTYVPGKSYSMEVEQEVEYAFETSFEVKGDIRPNYESWRASLDLGGAELPFNFVMAKDGENYEMEILNGTERIEVSKVETRNDSIFVELPVFHSAIMGAFDDDEIKGYWCNFARGDDYKIPIVAEKGKAHRFNRSEKEPSGSVTGKWEVTFSPETEDAYQAIGEFRQEGSKLEGTFITETGDYRYLEGVVDGETIQLSAFDGAHAFLFEGKFDGDRITDGTFWSGSHWKEPWVAVRNDEFSLRNPDSLTYLNEGYDKLAFTFPDLDSNLISLDDEKYRNKVVLVEVMGSWCPNCMDGTRFLTEVYNKYHDQGLEVIALAYENCDFKKSVGRVLKHKNDLSAPYDFLIAGVANKKKAAESLPMLNHVLSFPTTIYIDRSGEVRRIHTGFYGPGTGEYYARFKKEAESYVGQLVRE